MKYRMLGGLFVCFFMVMAINQPAGAHWITEDQPKIKDYQTNRWNNTNSSMNRDCEAIFTELVDGSSQCRTITSFGDFYGSQLVRPGTDQPARINGITGSPIPIPSSNNLFSARHMLALGGSYLYFYPGAGSNLSTEISEDGASVLNHRLHQDSEQLLQRPNGNYSLIDTFSISFSSNGKWMLGNVGNRLVRINTTDGSEFYFGDGTVAGDSRGLKTAVSSNGKYAFVSNQIGPIMRLYRLSDCVPDDTYFEYNDCPYTLISDSLNDEGFTPIFGTRKARFLQDSTLYLHFSTGFRLNTEAHPVLLFASGASEAEYDYLALGDSFASGEGAYNYRPETDSSINNCRVSRDSYSYLLRDDLQLNSFASVACSGAVINDVFVENTSLYAGQIDEIIKEKRGHEQKDDYLSSFFPGYLNQSDFINEYSPENITVSAIGNDVGFDDIIKRCVSPGTCYDSFEDRAELSQEIKSHIPRMTNMLSGLQKAGTHNATVYVIGYPQIVKEGGDCGVNVRLNSSEVEFANRLIEYLNAVIDIAARRSGAVYVDVSSAFSGFKLCEATDNPAMHGLTAGYDTPDVLGGPFGKESYHPTAFGHELLANEISIQTEGFAIAGEAIDDMAWFADSSVVDNFLFDSPRGKTNRPLYITHHEPELSTDFIVRGENIPVITNRSSSYSLQSNTVFEVWLHSDPILLGTLETDEEGLLDGVVELPESLDEDRYHTLRVEGKDIANQPVALHKTVFVSDVDYSDMPVHDNECKNDDGFMVYCEPEGQPEGAESDSENDTKPPVNNPETEAGDEQPNTQHPEETLEEGSATTEDSNTEGTQDIQQATTDTNDTPLAASTNTTTTGTVASTAANTPTFATESQNDNQPTNTESSNGGAVAAATDESVPSPSEQTATTATSLSPVNIVVWLLPYLIAVVALVSLQRFKSYKES